jgi:hypothetical protein
MMVKMLVDTSTPANGYVHAGDVVNVDEKTAERWVDHHIAQFVNSEPDELAKDEPDEAKKVPVLKKKKGK